MIFWLLFFIAFLGSILWYAIFYDDPAKLTSVGTGHTMQACNAYSVLWIDQGISMDWLI